ncbi:MAG: hypothetical protein A3B68_05525 [Candidatus Melainabacteria bacterium RIFCSPHIGHO2_02_FULL_34_12]|nr:MAG: hypothetical protein A3B68_05525 [Candidatus Melainabacteria bacterium RIFCSPHIGHO2_02_FULL_34_12]
MPETIKLIKKLFEIVPAMFRIIKKEEMPSPVLIRNESNLFSSLIFSSFLIMWPIKENREIKTKLKSRHKSIVKLNCINDPPGFMTDRIKILAVFQ